MIEYQPPWQVWRDWRAISAVLAPAMARNGKPASDYLQDAMIGGLEIFRISGPAEGYLAASVGNVRDTGQRALWVVLVAGKVQGGPKARVKVMRMLLDAVESLGRETKCTETRVEGRSSWRAVLTDYAVAGHDGNNTIFVKAL